VNHRAIGRLAALSGIVYLAFFGVMLEWFWWDVTKAATLWLSLFAVFAMLTAAIWGVVELVLAARLYLRGAKA